VDDLVDPTLTDPDRRRDPGLAGIAVPLSEAEERADVPFGEQLLCLGPLPGSVRQPNRLVRCRRR